MKCVSNFKGRVIRVSDARAAALVATRLWNYASKAEWKATGRAREGKS